MQRAQLLVGALFFQRRTRVAFHNRPACHRVAVLIVQTHFNYCHHVRNMLIPQQVVFLLENRDSLLALYLIDTPEIDSAHRNRTLALRIAGKKKLYMATTAYQGSEAIAFCNLAARGRQKRGFFFDTRSTGAAKGGLRRQDGIATAATPFCKGSVHCVLLCHAHTALCLFCCDVSLLYLTF